MKIKRLTAFALAIASLAGTAPVTGIVKPQSSICAAETKFEKTGKCGENVTYELSDDGTLTISGKGPMYNYGRPAIQISTEGANVDGKVITDGTSPFMGQFSIKKVVIEEGITTVGASMFLMCMGLTEVQFPSTMQAIYSDSFMNTALTSLDIPAATILFDPLAVDCDTLLESINVDEKNETYKSVDGVVFSKDMKKIICFPFGKKDEKYEVPEGVETICSNAFGSSIAVKSDDKYYENIRELILPSSMKEIESYGLNHMMNLENLTLPEGLSSIDASSLRNCNALKEVTFLNPYCKITGISFFSSDYNFTIKGYDVSYAHDFAAKEDVDFESIGRYTGKNKQPVPETSKATEQIKCGDDVICYVMDDTLVFKGSGPMYDFKSNDDQPFIDQFFDSPEQMIFDEGITYIGSYVGSGCSKLRYVSIPSTVTSIGEYAFNGSNDIIGFDLPAGLTKIGKQALTGCADLTAIHVAPENKNYKSIDGVLFDKSGKTLILFPTYKCEEYTIPDGTETIADYAFYNNSEKSKPKEQNSTEYISYGELHSIRMPDSVKTIGSHAFSGLELLESCNISKKVTSIGDSAFSGCKNLESIQFPDTLTQLGERAFSNCRKLESISIPSKLTEIGDDTFYYCTSLKDVVLPSNIHKIGGGAFMNCEALESLTICDPECAFPESSYVVSTDRSSTSEFKGTIYGYKGSTAEAHAKEFKYTFKEITSDPVTPTNDVKPVSKVCGDANLDGEVSLSDALLILQYVANSSKYNIEGQGLINADCCDTGDGITPLDALAIQRLDANLITSLPDKSK